MAEVSLMSSHDEACRNNAETLIGIVDYQKKRRSSTLATELDEDTDTSRRLEDSDSSLPSLSLAGSDDGSPSESEEFANDVATPKGVTKAPDNCIGYNDGVEFAPFVTDPMLRAQAWEEDGKIDQAIETLWPLLDVVGYYDFYGRVQLKLGTLFWQKGSYEASLQHLDQALLELEMVGANDEEIGTTFLAIGRTHLSLGNLRDAKKNFRYCIEHADAQHLYARATHALGMVFETMGKLKEANRLYQQALVIQRSLAGTAADTAATLISFGSLKEKYGELALSMSCYTEAHRIYTSMPPCYKTSVDVGAVLSSIGWVLYLQGHLDQSLLTCAKALNLLTALGQHRNVATVLLQVGIIHERLCHHKHAGELCRKALRMQVKLLGKKHLDVAIALSTNASLVTTKPDQAIKYAAKALKIRLDMLGSRDTLVGYSYAQLGDAYRQSANEAMAHECHCRAQEILE